MARVEGQNIPSELLELYKTSLVPFYTIHGAGTVRKRCPFRIPHLQDIARLFYPRQHGGPSAKQKEVREIFRLCTSCFEVQPNSGGATPPDIGPRNRSWWYTDSTGSGLFYYTYFMQQTLDAYFSGNAPDWCRKMVVADTFTSEGSPDTNYGGEGFVEAGKFPGGAVWGYFLKDDDKEKQLHLYIIGTIGDIGATETYYLDFYKVNTRWNQYSLTWNNQPTDEGFISTISLTGNDKKWISLPIGIMGSTVVKYRGPENAASLIAAKQHATATKRPFWTY